MTAELDGQVAIITGGSRGLGHAMARALAQQGARTVLASRNSNECVAAAARVQSDFGSPSVGAAADVSNPQDTDLLVRRAVDAFGRIDILVNAAGIMVRGGIEETSVEEFDRCFAVNLRGSWLMCRSVAAVMKAARYGRIINVASVQSFVGLTHRTAYASTKGGIASLTRALALEWAAAGITVNAIAPGAFVTPMVERASHTPEFSEMIQREVPLGRSGRLEEVYGAVQLLASPRSSYILGAIISVDGGWVAH
ncbi:MAG TPA: SDR family oxidoreductase [Ramlibacter sp.]|uniref:SDR family NAD(P)-dependent oxidoreductase n=1 Tax=Ramlibacter sp. TaxID=1917967 RepID=UPI002B5DDD11|nr:SDR family oxidoreductase [Ramlibacter sp.]HVZ45498.1 SDR family oxidoreductase [Ramlibacter sp.]